MGTLFDADDSVLVLVDVQPGLLRRLDRPVAERVVESTTWLVRVARVLAVPIVVTELQPSRHGATEPSVVAALAPDQARHERSSFGLASSPVVLAAATDTGRRAAVVVGLETDVGVAQSAIGLHDLGWKVAVVLDAVASPGRGDEQGLARLRDVGIALVGVKGLVHEWVGTVERAGLAGLPAAGPGGVEL